VNPQPVMGVAWFARIARELGDRRPDIPFLVVKGRGGVRWLERVPVDLGGPRTLHGMHSPFPQEFYAASQVVLVPSLWEETFARVAAAALANGLPVLASNRGRCRRRSVGRGWCSTSRPGMGRTLDAPTAEEVAGWVVAIERLYDEGGYFEEHYRLARERG
jgi:glycosyltransferase involved in cell wall biosynthesis